MSIVVSETPTRQHCFSQTLLLTPPWGITLPLGDTTDTSAADQHPQHSTTATFTTSVVYCHPQGTKVQWCPGQRRKHSFLYSLSYIWLRYKKYNGQHILSLQLKPKCWSMMTPPHQKKHLLPNSQNLSLCHRTKWTLWHD